MIAVRLFDFHFLFRFSLFTFVPFSRLFDFHCFSIFAIFLVVSTPVHISSVVNKDVHSMPVRSICSNPAEPEVLYTCSGDGTIAQVSLHRAPRLKLKLVKYVATSGQLCTDTVARLLFFTMLLATKLLVIASLIFFVTVKWNARLGTCLHLWLRAGVCRRV